MNGSENAAVIIAMAQHAGSGNTAEAMLWPVALVALVVVLIVIALLVVKDILFKHEDNFDDTYNSRL